MTARKSAAVPSKSVPLVNGAAPADDPTGWNDVLGQLDGADDIEVHIYAEPDKGNGGSAWCFSCSPDDYTWSDLLTRIKNDPELGPGRYSLRAKRGTQFVGRKVVQIAGRPRSHLASPVPASGAAAPQPDILAAMREMQAQADKRFSDLLMVLLTKMPTGNGGGTSITDVIAAAKMLTEGKREPADPIVGIKQLLEVQALLKAAADGSGESMGAGAMDAIVKALEIFGPAIAAGATDLESPLQTLPTDLASPLQTLPSRLDPASSVPAVAAAAPAPKPKPKPDPMRILLHRLIRAAARDGDPGVYAQVTLDELGDDVTQRLLALPDPQAMLVKLEPRMEQHREWFAAVLVELREAYAPEPDDGKGGLTTPEAGQDLSTDDPATA